MFFVLLTVILYYSFGYKYDFNNGRTVQVGAIIIKTEPKESVVYINGKLLEKNIFENLFNNYTKIENLDQKMYNIKITKDNYSTWGKNISVRGGHITELKNVVLLKNDYRKNILLKDLEIDSKLNNIWNSNTENKIAYQKKSNGELNVFIFDFKSKRESLITNYILPPEKDRDYYFNNIIWSDNNQKIILKVNSVGDDNKYLWHLIDLENNNKTCELNNIFGEKKEIRNKWNFDFDETLFYLQNNTLYEFTCDRPVPKKVMDNISNFSIIDNSIYYFKIGDNNLYSVDYFQTNTTKNVLAITEDFDSKLPLKIIKSKRNTYLILSSNGNLYFLSGDGKITLLNSFVKKAYFSNNDQRVIYSNDHEIWIYYLDEKRTQPIKEERTNELLTRYSGKIDNVFLYKDEEHLFYQEGDIFKFIELDDRDKINVFDILKLKGNDIFYARNDNTVYYVEENKLIQIELNEK